jgi:hypothetical protein
VRSGDVRLPTTAATMLLLAGALSGCVESTQQKNARAQLRDDRLLATRSAVQVTRPDRNIAVLGVRVLRSSTGTAVAVTLRNDSAKPVSDLAINVGISAPSGRTYYLNRQPELPYFQTHIGGVGAGAQATWVFSRAGAAPAGRAFARVGPASVHTSGASTLPSIASSVTALSAQGRAAAALGAEISNRSGVPQDALQSYAYALAGERLVAAGTAPLGSLGSGAVKALQLKLLGNPGSSAVHVETPPTNLR